MRMSEMIDEIIFNRTVCILDADVDIILWVFHVDLLLQRAEKLRTIKIRVRAILSDALCISTLILFECFEYMGKARSER